ncbi:MAG: FAD-binding protein [Clostridia bacterium]|nr:FAD-binding protein [Clostridia bacterium]
MKKSIAMLLTAAMLMGSVAAGAESTWNAGTYSANAKGFAGDVTVTVTADANGITDVTVTGANETPALGGAAMPQLAEAIKAAQSADVETVTGATVTSTAVKNAAAEAIALAKGETIEIPAVKMKPGTYTGYGAGFSQTREIPVTITVSETNILTIDVAIKAAAETEHLIQTAIDLMLPRIIEHNSLSVDAICGATTSSNGIKAAIADALTQALEAAGTPASALQNFYGELNLVPGETQTIDVDVLVVGMGGTGSAAAMRVAELQQAAGKEVNVLAIEKSGSYGGTSSATTSLLAFNSELSEVYATATETDIDMRASHRDDAEEIKKTEGTFFVNTDEIAEYLTSTGVLGVGNKYAERYWDNTFNVSGPLVDWLIGHGYYFGAPRLGFWGPWHTQFYYCDSAGEANLPRIHACFDRMMEDYEALGGKYMLETEGYELIYDAATNTVTGVKAHNMVDGTEYVINAKSIILATGGFGGNSEMMTEYNTGDFWLWGMAQNDGKLMKNAIEIGAGTLGMNASMWGGVHNISTMPQLNAFETQWATDGTWDIWRDDLAAWSLNDVPNIIVASHDSLWVSKDGTRNVAEDMMWAWPLAGDIYYTIVNQNWIDNITANGFAANHVELFCNDGYATFPLNTPIPEMPEVLAACEEVGIVVSADTIEELAAKLNMDPAVLSATYAAYNEACSTGVDALGKAAANLVSIEGGKLYAFKAAPRPYSSIGGLDVSEKFEVVTTDGETVINGLYAAGTDCLGATAPAFGGELQLWAYMSGYLAAESATEAAMAK